MPKLPAPPLPKPLNPKPRRPGDQNEKMTPLETAAEAGISVVDWIDERTSLSPAAALDAVPQGPEGDQLVLHARLGDDVRLPQPGRHRRIPGDVLPARRQGGAYESIRYINDQAFLGQFVRAMHKWGASVMIILIFLHMARVFFFGAYKYPRELTWIIGVVLLILTMAMGFTGYLLPFDQRSYWATIVGVNINGTGPLIGPYLSDFLRAGPEFGANTLSRFYAIHMLLIPGIMAALIGIPPLPDHEARDLGAAMGEGRRRDAPAPSRLRSELGVNQAEKEAYLREYSQLKNQGKPFFPYAVAKDSIMAVIVMTVIIFLSLMFGAEMGPKVNPTTTTYVPRPDWYFYFLFEVLRVMKNVPKFTPMATIGVPTICMILLFLLPLYDRSPERRIERRPVALAAGLFTIAAMAFLTYSGANTGSPNSVDLKPPANLTAARAPTFIAGELVVGQSGCLACHTIGDNGNNGPGRT